MLGKASELKFDKVDTFYGSYTNSDSIEHHLMAWGRNYPKATIVEIQYRTYQATDGDGNVSWGESVLIIYKEESA